MVELSHSVWFNRRHGRVGHLFQGRFQSVLVDSRAWGWELSRYVHLNPVRVGTLGLGKVARAGQRAGVSGPPQSAQVREQGGLRGLAKARPELEQVIAGVERVRGERWEAFRDRHGDGGRDLVLYLGRRVCGLKLGELARRTGVQEYGTVWAAVRRYEQRLRQSPADRKQLRQVSKLLNVEM